MMSVALTEKYMKEPAPANIKTKSYQGMELTLCFFLLAG